VRIQTLTCLALALAACGAKAINYYDSYDDIGTGAVPEAGSPEAMPPVSWILAGQAQNARDLGGTPLADGSTVAHGKVYRGGPLSGLDATGCAEFARLGIRTIVDLRTEGEFVYVPDAACATAQAQLVHAPMPVPYSVSPADYIADLDATASVAAVFALLATDGACPLYFHCTYGRDRSGVLAAAILSALGATHGAIMDEYQLTAAAGLGSYPESLQAVLDEIDRRGGIEAYLASAGVSADAVTALRARLIAR